MSADIVKLCERQAPPSVERCDDLMFQCVHVAYCETVEIGRHLVALTGRLQRVRGLLLEIGEARKLDVQEQAEAEGFSA
jgi:hypothetical protein